MNIKLLSFLILSTTTQCALSTNLHLAAKINSIFLFNQTLTEEININTQNNKGQTPLHISSKTFSNFIGLALIHKKANLNIQDQQGNTPLHIAVINNNTFMVEYLIDNNAQLNIQNNDGDTPLHIAANFNRNFIIIPKLLSSLTADATIANNNGKTPITIAHEKNYKLIKKSLTNHFDKLRVKKFNSEINNMFNKHINNNNGLRNKKILKQL